MKHSLPAAPVGSAEADHRPNVPGGLLTAEDLAARWQVPRSQVYRLARDGRVPVVALGRYYRFRLPDVEAWEAAGGSACAE